MDAGVPISDPVGGISIGLVQDEAAGRHVLLTDIIGDEDHFGDMDFKVAGTQRGVTGIQLDLKNHGITEQIIRETLEQAHEARLEILRAMLRSIKRPRDEISANAPRLIQIQINPEKIGLVIGPGGKTIRRLQEETGAKIDIDDSGVVTLSSLEAAGAEAARDKIVAMTEGVQVGRIYEGRVTSIKEFGAFVEILPGKDGLVHISELSDGYVSSVTDVCRVGDPMLVKAIAVDDQDRVKLSRKAALAERGQVDELAGRTRPARRRRRRRRRRAAAARPAARRRGVPAGGGGDRDRGGYGGDRGGDRGGPDDRGPSARPSARPATVLGLAGGRSIRVAPVQTSGNRRRSLMANLCPARSRTRSSSRGRERRHSPQSSAGPAIGELARPPSPRPTDRAGNRRQPAARPVRRDLPARRRAGPRDPQPALDGLAEPRSARRGLSEPRDPARPPRAAAGRAAPARGPAAARHPRELPPVRPRPGPEARADRLERDRRRAPRLLRAARGDQGDRDPHPARGRLAPSPASMPTCSSRPCLNLILNAEHAMPSGGELILTTRREGPGSSST